MRVTPTANVLAALTCLNLLLGVKLVMLGLGEDSIGSQQATWDAPLPRSIAGAAGQRPAEAFAEIVTHPVFYKSRQAFVPPPPAPPPAPVVHGPVVPADPGFLVAGVLLKQGVSKAYLLSRAGSGGGSWVGEREIFLGWQVKAISSSGVKVEQGGRLVELHLYPVN
ncbi:hypothetical protein [Bradyrhizobium sp. SZCCHNS3004]|uniref:hypothetical protein n=1 Tax=Bradyrhizobium sp. SZCCHNS3004 TaxID=3057312 RepID=UPI002915EBC6|nr:hypothetical protein [Bradyrhizobium sp. SZCCHNS3004]